MLGVIGSMVLVFLPGAWITFGLRLSDLPLWAKFLIGTALGPLVTCLQFYAIRLLGAPFGPTVMLLPILNLPALYLILRQLGHLSLPGGRAAAGWVLVLLVPFACFAPALIDTQGRVYASHHWMYSDPVYLVANGSLVPEEPELAGLRLSYPSVGLVHQGILSYLLDSPPALSYIWKNMLWLLLIFGFMAGIVAELGGDRFARMTSVIWLSSGVNFVGFVVWKLADSVNSVGFVVLKLVKAVGGRYSLDILGDPRYTPWVLKFLFFKQEPLALGIFAALAFLLVRQWRAALSRDTLVLIGLLLCGMGLLYPLLFPAAAALVGAKVVALLLERRWPPQAVSWRQIVGLGTGLLLAGIVTLVYLRFLDRDRVMRAAYRSWKQLLIWKAMTSVVVTSPLTVGLGFAFRRCWNERRSATIVLLLGALASLILYVGLWIPGFHNEYKFIFTAAICLAPFSSLALGPFLDGLGRRALPVLAIAALILASPMAYKMCEEWPWLDAELDYPVVDVRSFELRLADGDRFSGLCDAIRHRTPPDSILVLENAELRFPTLTGRGLYVPPYQERPHPGVGVVSEDILVESRGYDKQIIEDRRLVLKELFHSDDESRMAQSLHRILELKRPVAIVMDKGHDTALLEWLAGEGRGLCLYEGAGLVLWLVEPGKG